MDSRKELVKKVAAKLERRESDVEAVLDAAEFFSAGGPAIPEEDPAFKPQPDEEEEETDIEKKRKRTSKRSFRSGT